MIAVGSAAGAVPVALPGPPAFVLLAIAVWACGTGRRSRPTSARARGRSPSAIPRASPRLLGAAAGVAALLACVAAGGPVPGAAAAVLVVPAVVLAVYRLAARAGRDHLDVRLPLALDLAAAALRAGAPPASALRLGAPAADRTSRLCLEKAGGLLGLGADPAEAWRHGPRSGPLAAVADCARRSADSGIRLADGWERLAGRLRDEARAEQEQRAQRVGVLALVPLGLCFLPSFVCLGVVPVIIGIARTVHSAVTP